MYRKAQNITESMLFTPKYRKNHPQALLPHGTKIYILLTDESLTNAMKKYTN